MLFRNSLEELLLPSGTGEETHMPSPINKSSRIHVGANFSELTPEKYTIEYENETLFIDSLDWRQSNLLKAQILTSYACYIIFGMAEQTVGVLIPRFQTYYKVDDMQTSFIFLAVVLGYIISAVMSETTHQRVGVKGVLLGGGMCMVSGYSMISLKPPFFLLVCFYVLNGLALGALDAGINTWMGGLKDSNPILGILHGCYGIGCMISPPLISHLLSRKHNPWKWNYYYYVLASLAVFALVTVAVTFRYETAKKFRYQNVMKATARAKQENDVELQLLEDGEETEEAVEDHAVPFLEVVKSKLVWTFAIILFTYVGGEVAFGSWLISFLMRIKKLSYKKSSYMATSFWTGLTVGRMCLGFVTEMFFANELTANLVYIAGSFGGLLLFWLLAFTNAVPVLFLIVFLTGISIGPIFPTTIVAAINILPVRFHTAGVGFICAFGGGGGAAVPFLIGTIAESSASGMRIFPLVICILYGLLLVGWGIVTKKFNH